MADTGENKQITGRANAKAAEVIRSEKKMLSTERAAVKKSDAAFARPIDRAKGGPRRDKALPSG